LCFTYDRLGGLAGVSSSSEVVGVVSEVMGEEGDSSGDTFGGGLIISVGAAEGSTESKLIFLPANWSLNFFIINNYIYRFHHSLCSFIEDPVSTTVCGISQEYTFITLGIKFSQILLVTKYITFNSKSFEVLYRGFFTSPNFLGSLVCLRPQVDPVDDMTGNVYNFSLEVLSKIL
jgi:hypothetical protein